MVERSPSVPLEKGGTRPETHGQHLVALQQLPDGSSPSLRSMLLRERAGLQVTPDPGEPRCPIFAVLGHAAATAVLVSPTLMKALVSPCLVCLEAVA